MIKEFNYTSKLPGVVLFEVWRGQPPGCYDPYFEIVQQRTITEEDCQELGISYYENMSAVGVWMRIDKNDGEVQWARYYYDMSNCRNAFEATNGYGVLNGEGSNVSTMLDQYQLDDLKNAIQFGPQKTTLDEIKSEMGNMGFTSDQILEAIQELVRASKEQESVAPVMSLTEKPRLGKRTFTHRVKDDAGGEHEIAEWTLNRDGIVLLEGRKTIVTWTRVKPNKLKKKGSPRLDFCHCYETLAAAFANHKGYRPPSENSSGVTGHGGSIIITAGDGGHTSTPSANKDKKKTTMEDRIGYDATEKTRTVAAEAFKRGVTVAAATQFFSKDLTSLLMAKAKQNGLPEEFADHEVARKTVEALLPFILHAAVHHFEGTPKREFFLTASALAMEGTSKDAMQPVFGFVTGFFHDAIGLAKEKGLAEVIDIDTGKEKGAEPEAATGTEG